MRAAAATITDRHPSDRRARQQRRADGPPRVGDGRRQRDAVRRQPPRATSCSTNRLLPAIAAGGRPGRDRHQHGPPHRAARVDPANPNLAGPLRTVAGLRAVEARQLPLRHRAARAAARPPDRPSPACSPTPACRTPTCRRTASPPRAAAAARRFFARRSPTRTGHGAVTRRAAPAARRHRPRGAQRPVLRAALGQQRAAGRRPILRRLGMAPLDRGPVGGVRAPDR